MIYHDIDQNSEEWDLLRIGKFTASTFSDLFMDKSTKGYKDAILKVAYEKVTGESEERFSSKYMQRGHEKEQFAAENYELYTFNQTEIVGFYEYNEFVGASPDRKILNQLAGCEFKCPSFRIYDEYLNNKKLPKDYFWQIHGQMLCTGWNYIDFMPFSSNKLKQVLVTIEKDSLIQEQLIEKLYESIKEVKKKIEEIINR